MRLLYDIAQRYCTAMNKDDGISPVRVSKLKKRRRGGRESSGTCGLQNLGSSPKQNRQSNVTTTTANDTSTVSRGDGYCKENRLNGNPALSGRQSMPSMQGDGDNMNIDKNDGTCDVNQSTKPDGMEDVSSLSSTNYKSTLRFIDNMDQSKLISALPSMLGIDSDKYKTNSKDFQQCLERSFNTNINNSNTTVNNNKDSGVYHPLVGRIDHHPTKSSTTNNTIGAEKDMLSFAFPQCTNSSEKDVNEEEVVDPYNIFQHLNLVRKSEHGMTLPASWYQFPQTQTKSSSPSSVILAASVNEKVAANTNMEQMKKQPVIEKSKSLDDEEDADDEMDLINADDTTTKHYFQPDQQNDTTLAAKKPPLKAYPPAEDNEKYNRQKGQQQSSVIDNKQAAPLPLPPMKYPGRIRIISNKGATIREVFDIDNSKVVLGKLQAGDERYYIEKKTLPPPPISIDDSDEESDDDECVAVVRYKIALEATDLTNEGQGESNEPMVGWISDRGRFADEPYLILKVI